MALTKWLSVVVLALLVYPASGLDQANRLLGDDPAPEVDTWSIDMGAMLQDIENGEEVPWFMGCGGTQDLLFERVDRFNDVIEHWDADGPTGVTHTNEAVGYLADLPGDGYGMAHFAVGASTKVFGGAEWGNGTAEYFSDDGGDTMEVTSWCYPDELPVPAVSAVGKPDCQGVYDKALVGVWYDENFVDDDGGDDQFVTDAFLLQEPLWKQACIESSVMIASITPLTIDLQDTCSEALATWVTWVDVNYPEVNRIAGDYEIDAWQLFTGRGTLWEDCAGYGRYSERYNHDADSNEQSIVIASYYECFVGCTEELRTTNSVGKTSAHELGHNWASLEHKQKLKCETDKKKINIMHSGAITKRGYCLLNDDARLVNLIGEGNFEP